MYYHRQHWNLEVYVSDMCIPHISSG